MIHKQTKRGIVANIEAPGDKEHCLPPKIVPNFRWVFHRVLPKHDRKALNIQHTASNPKHESVSKMFVVMVPSVGVTIQPQQHSLAATSIDPKRRLLWCIQRRDIKPVSVPIDIDLCNKLVCNPLFAVP